MLAGSGCSRSVSASGSTRAAPTAGRSCWRWPRLESLALTYRRVVAALETLTGRQIDTLRVVGGGSQNTMLCQLTADACQRTVVAGPAEGTALGNILVQAIATGHLPDLAAGRRAVAASVDQTIYTPRAGGGWDAALAARHAV